MPRRSTGWTERVKKTSQRMKDKDGVLRDLTHGQLSKKNRY